MCMRIKNCVRAALYGMGAMWRGETDRPTDRHRRTQSPMREHDGKIGGCCCTPSCRVCAAGSMCPLLVMVLLERLDGPTAAIVVLARSLPLALCFVSIGVR